MAEPIISDLALRGVGYEPEAHRTRFSILNKFELIAKIINVSEFVLRQIYQIIMANFV
jgi:hypothetical protein